MSSMRSSPILALVIAIASSLVASSGLTAGQQPPKPGAAPPVRDGAARPAATGTGLIAGIVRSADAQPRPIRRARVLLEQTEMGPLTRLVLLTDDAGRFQFSGLAPGRYLVSSSLPGWVDAGYGARTPGAQGLTLALTEGQRLDTVVLAMARGAAITGRVLETNGQAVVGARVLASERRMLNGVATYQYGYSWVLTDDRGVYRIFGLRAGTYLVSVTPESVRTSAGRVVTPAELQWVSSPPAPGSSLVPAPPPGPTRIYAQVFHPGATEVNAATPITLMAGEEREGADVTMQLVPTVKVSGTVTRPDGQRAAAAQIVVTPLDQPILDPFSMVLRNIAPRNSTNGEFSFSDIQPGRYIISARAASNPGPGPGAAPATVAGAPGGRGAPPPALDLWASAEISVAGADIEGLALTLQPGMTIAGRVVFEGAAPPPDLSRMQVRLLPSAASGGVTVTTSTTQSMVAADGAFSIRGVSPGLYDLLGSVPGMTAGAPTWMLKSAVSGSRSLLDAPVDIRPGGDLSDVVVTFTDKVTEITGLLLDQAGRPAPEFYVIVFPTDTTRWSQRNRWLRPPTRPSSDGRYRITGLPPGEFYLAALTEFDPNGWSSAAFLEQVVPGAIKITIGEGEKKVQDVRLGI